MLGPRPGGPAQDGAPAPTPAGQVAYRIRDVLLMIAIAGFISLLLNPLVAVLQRWGIRRRGWAVALVMFVALTVLEVPFPLLWALWVTLVDFLPMVGGALAGIPTALFAFGHSIFAGIVTAAVFLIGTSVGDWVGGLFGSFVAALLAIPVAGGLQVIVRELWQASARPNV